jgi:hypothetical protein
MTPQEQACYLIDRLGGCVKVANMLGAKPSSVSNWKHRGVPWKYRAAMSRAIVSIGFNVPQGFLGE